MNKKIIISVAACLPIMLPAAPKELFKSESLVETTKNLELTKTAIAVEPDRKYQISFSARTDGEHTLEENERIRIMNHRYTASRLRLEFLDEKGSAFPQNYYDVFVLSKEFHRYVQAFYPPAAAKTLKILLLPVKNADLAVEKVVLVTDLTGGEGDCLNPHPTFEHGDLNDYGCHSGYGGRFYMRPGGKTVWKTGFLGYSPFFPVKGGEYYVIFCRGVKYRDRKSFMLLECYKEKERKPFKSMRIEISEKGEKTRLLVPDDVTRARLCCYCVILEEFTIKEHDGKVK